LSIGLFNLTDKLQSLFHPLQAGADAGNLTAMDSCRIIGLTFVQISEGFFGNCASISTLLWPLLLGGICG